MIWLGAALLLLAVVRTVRWWVRRVDALGRVSAFPAITVGLLVALGAVAVSLVLLHDKTENRLSSAASAIAGTPVRVHCQSLGQASVDPGPELGYVRYWLEVYPQMPDAYRTTARHPGGALDEHLPEAPWS